MTPESVTHMILYSRLPKSRTGRSETSHRKFLMLYQEGATFRLDSNQSISLLAKQGLNHPLFKSNSLQRILIRAEKKRQGEDKRQRPLKLSPQFTNKAGSQHFAKQSIHLPPLPHLWSEPTRGPEVPPDQSPGAHVTQGSLWADLMLPYLGQKEIFCVKIGLGSKENSKKWSPWSWQGSTEGKEMVYSLK